MKDSLGLIVSRSDDPWAAIGTSVFGDSAVLFNKSMGGEMTYPKWRRVTEAKDPAVV